MSSNSIGISEGDALTILENTLNVRVTAISAIDYDDDGRNCIPLLEHVRDLLSVWSEAEIPVNYEDVISVSYLDVISRHLDGSMMNLNPVAKSGNKVGAENDVAAVMTGWFLESIERSYNEERNHTKVRLLIILIKLPSFPSTEVFCLEAKCSRCH